MPLIRIAIALVTLAALLVTDAPAQTTSARSDSLELSGRADRRRTAGEHEQAVRIYRRALALDEQNQRAYLGLSASLDALGRHRDALAVIDSAESILGWTPELGLQRGIHLSRLRRWDAAAAALGRVLDREGESYDAAYYLAAAQLQRGDWLAAVAAIDRYLATRPGELAVRDPEIRIRRAFALLHAGELQRARRDLAAVLAANPDSRAGRVLMVTALAKQGRCARALAIAGELDRAGLASPSLTYNTALCRFRTGDPRGALGLIESSAWPSPAPPRGHLLTAEIHASLGNTDRARASYRRALAAGLPAETRFARWLIGIGEQAEALALLSPLVDAGATDPELLELAASAARTAGDLDRAAIASARLVEVRPDPASHNLRGEILLARRDWAGAEASFSAALATEPKNRRAAVGLRRALASLADAAFRAGERDRARALLERAHRADPEAAAVAFNLALLELRRGEPARAIELVGGRIEALASPARGHLLLCRALLATGDRAGAIAALERALTEPRATDAERGRALSDLAGLLAHSEPARAVELIGRARDLAGIDAALLDRAEAEARLALAERAYRQGAPGDVDRALAAVRVDALPGPARDRYALLEPFAVGARQGLASALRSVGQLTDDQLSALASELPPKALRHALALQLGRHLFRRTSDYRRHLRGHLRGLAAAAAGSKTAGALATGWLDAMMQWAIDNGSAGLARDLARDAPRGWQSDRFRHNAIVAGGGRLSKAERRELEDLAETVPEALVNLAADAERRSDHAAALGYLNRIPRARRSAAVTDWLRWKELFHGSR